MIFNDNRGQTVHKLQIALIWDVYIIYIIYMVGDIYIYNIHHPAYIYTHKHTHIYIYIYIYRERYKRHN